jgi:uncharacterized membrane protein SpoIIM required for sporulation
MKQGAFEALNAPKWDSFEAWIRVLSGADSGSSEKRALIGRQFPPMYRQICHHLALARTRRYSIGLQQRLNQLALDGHQYMYRSRTSFVRAIGRFTAVDFPAAFRRCWKYMAASATLFYLPALGMALAVQTYPDLVFSLLNPFDVSRMEDMYDPGNTILGRERASDTDVMMFGYYIYNNISIGFRTFAGGLLFGLGSLFFIVFNGLFFGAVSSHLILIGSGEPFWSFVAGHSSFELTAIVIFGGVGLMLGYGALAPGRKSRWHAIRDQAIAAVPLIYGGSVMLVAAAFIEAFWSSTTWPPVQTKYLVGSFLWFLHGIYFAFMGRNES